MSEHEVFSGFPNGGIRFRSSDEDFRARISRVAYNLVETQLEGVPFVTYERYELNLAAPDDSGEKAIALRWPMSRTQYDAFWNPKVEQPDEQTPRHENPAKIDPLDIFKPKQSVDEEEEYDPQAAVRARKQQERAILAARFAVVNSVLDEIPNDPFIQAFIDSHGTFDRAQGQHIPLGFNLDGIDRNIYYKREDKLSPLFDPRNLHRVSGGGVDTITGSHMSLTDGSLHTSDTNREQWEQSLRDDLNTLTESLRSVPQHYLDVFDEEGYLLSDQYYGTERQIGTIASKEFYKGYYQFADEGITLLKAIRMSNLFGAIDYKSSESVGNIATTLVALKHGVAGRPHLVRLQTVASEDPSEPYAEVRVFPYPLALDGAMLRERIGGYYGDLKHDLPGTIARMGAPMRSEIAPPILERMVSGEAVGTEITGFSHKDFYDIIEYLSSIALSESDY